MTATDPGLSVSFWIPGTPVPQGSKNVTRKGRMYEANKALKPWRDIIEWTTKAHMRTFELHRPFVTAQVTAVFVFPRPKHHYNAAGEVFTRFRRIPHTTKPDCDKLQRALGDGLTAGGMLKDDAVVWRWDATKSYVSVRFPQPGVWVEIRP